MAEHHGRARTTVSATAGRRPALLRVRLHDDEIDRLGAVVAIKNPRDVDAGALQDVPPRHSKRPTTSGTVAVAAATGVVAASRGVSVAAAGGCAAVVRVVVRRMVVRGVVACGVVADGGLVGAGVVAAGGVVVTLTGSGAGEHALA
jgi:hypothetical protein